MTLGCLFTMFSFLWKKLTKKVTRTLKGSQKKKTGGETLFCEIGVKNIFKFHALSFSKNRSKYINIWKKFAFSNIFFRALRLVYFPLNFAKYDNIPLPLLLRIPDNQQSRSCDVLIQSKAKSRKLWKSWWYNNKTITWANTYRV